MNNNLKRILQVLQDSGVDKKEYEEYIMGLARDLKKKKYGLVWEEQEEVIVEHLKNKYPILKEVSEREIKLDENKPINLLIEGDNYEALKALQFTHKGRIDVIYIDPPYNTGNKDFIYNDRFVDTEDTYRHSKWLSFMSKRLKLSKELIKEHGVVFISIDDNEYCQLKLLCDEIFGEKNQLGVLIQNKGNTQNDAKNIQKNHEYILAYCKNKPFIETKEIPLLLNHSIEEKEVIFDGDNYYFKGAAIVTGGDGGTLNSRPNLGYTIYFNEYTKETIGVKDYDLELAKTSNEISQVYFDRQDLIELGYTPIRPPSKQEKLGCWTWSLDKFNRDKDMLLISKTRTGHSIYKKNIVDKKHVFKKEEKYYTLINKLSNVKSLIDFSSAKGTNCLIEILGKKMFNNPKNLDMIKFLISLFSIKEVVILDFFAGSGTTGHAVLELNKEDGGNRQFILCTNNENNICEEVTYQRLSKVINGYTTPKGKEVAGLGGNLKYYKVGYIEESENIHQNRENLIRNISEYIKIKTNCFNVDIETEDFVIISNQAKIVGFVKHTLVDEITIAEMEDLLLQSQKEKELYLHLSQNDLFETKKDISYFKIPDELICR